MVYNGILTHSLRAPVTRVNGICVTLGDIYTKSLYKSRSEPQKRIKSPNKGKGNQSLYNGIHPSTPKDVSGKVTHSSNIQIGKT